MAKTITFKPEFENKLKKLKIKTKFVRNWKNDPDVTPLEDLNTAKTWDKFVSWAFIWINTPEGMYYWHEQSKK